MNGGFKMSLLSEQEMLDLQEESRIARGAILKATTLAGSGHPGGSMSSIDILLTLYKVANINPQNRLSEDRDRIVVSNGHISPAVYSALSLNDFFPMEDFISQFRLAGSIFEGHVERDTPGVEWGTGNLGQGLSAGCGFAIASMMKNIENRIFVVMGDGEQQKGQLSEARRFAAKYKLNNITAFVDYNHLQIGGDIGNIMPQDIKANYTADGWSVIEIDGHSFPQILTSLEQAEKNKVPTLILAHTVMGKNVSFMESKEKYHGAAISKEQLLEALAELSLENDFDHYEKLRKNYHAERSCGIPGSGLGSYDSWPQLSGGKAKLYDHKLDNRSAWGNALADIALINKKDKFTPIAVFDCDLQGSVKTKQFEENLPDNFFQCGISEHHAATIAGALSIENIQTFFAGFGVFGIDETYNQHRLNDINHTNLKLVVTHVGLDVGEDGKTHQCLDYVGLIKNLYNFKIIVPVCPNQTDRVIRYIAGQRGNYLVAMGRSKVPVIRNEDGTIFYDENYQFIYGQADLIREGVDGALLVMGSVASKAVQIVDKLSQKGIDLQLWSVACPTELNAKMLDQAAQTGTIFTYEDHNINSGLGNSVADSLIKHDIRCRLYKYGVHDYCLSGKSDDVYQLAGLDAESIAKKIEETISKG